MEFNIDLLIPTFQQSSTKTLLKLRTLSLDFASNMNLAVIIVSRFHFKSRVEVLLIMCGFGKNVNIVNLTLKFLKEKLELVIENIHLKYCWPSVLEEISTLNLIEIRLEPIKDIHEIPFDVFEWLYKAGYNRRILFKLSAYLKSKYYFYLRKNGVGMTEENRNILHYALISPYKSVKRINDLLKYNNYCYSIIDGEFLLVPEGQFKLKEPKSEDLNYLSMMKNYHDCFPPPTNFDSGIEFSTLSNFPIGSPEYEYIIRIFNKYTNRKVVIQISKPYHVRSDIVYDLVRRCNAHNNFNIKLPSNWSFDQFDSPITAGFVLSTWRGSNGHIHLHTKGSMIEILEHFGSKELYHEHKAQLIDFFGEYKDPLSENRISYLNVCPEFYQEAIKIGGVKMISDKIHKYKRIENLYHLVCYTILRRFIRTNSSLLHKLETICTALAGNEKFSEIRKRLYKQYFKQCSTDELRENYENKKFGKGFIKQNLSHRVIIRHYDFLKSIELVDGQDLGYSLTCKGDERTIEFNYKVPYEISNDGYPPGGKIYNIIAANYGRKYFPNILDKYNGKDWQIRRLIEKMNK